MSAALHELDIERDWLDGLKAIDEQFTEAPRARQRMIRVGRGLLAGRFKCPANTEFGEWVKWTGYGVIAPNERQDSMWCALNAAIILPILEPTNITTGEVARRYYPQDVADRL